MLGGAVDAQQAVGLVVRDVLPGIEIDLGHQSAKAITLELRMQLWAFADESSLATTPTIRLKDRVQ